MHILSTAVSARRVSQSSTHDGKSFRKTINSSDEASASKAKRASRRPRLCRHLRKTSALRHPPGAILPAPSPSRRKARLTIRGGGFALPSHDPPARPQNELQTPKKRQVPWICPVQTDLRCTGAAADSEETHDRHIRRNRYRRKTQPIAHRKALFGAHLRQVQGNPTREPARIGAEPILCIGSARMADPPEAQAVDSSAFLHIASPRLPTGNSNPSQTHAQDAIRASSSEFSCRSALATSPPNLVRITMREISPKMATKPRSGTGCVLPRVGLRAVEDKSPGRLCPSIAFALHLPPLALRHVPERGFVAIFGRFCRTTSSH